VAPSKNADREARDRLRRYNARQQVHEVQVTRRRRDNIIAVVGVVVIAALATVTQIFYFTAGPGLKPTASPSPGSSITPTPSATSTPAAGSNTGDVPAKTIAEGRTWTGELDLNSVKLGISLDGKDAPQAASVFISLARSGFYTKTGPTCHRLTTGSASLIQCGSVNGDGTGDPGFAFGPLENVPADGVYPAGTIAMARTDSPYSNGSQFFITYKDSPLDGSTGGYTVFGHVTSGLDTFISTIADKGTADGSDNGKPKVPTSIAKVTVK
jgi:peptidyl-prolyl cis-trans isomerase B (cyclophilin B)